MANRRWVGTMMGVLVTAGCNAADTEGGGGQAAIATAGATGTTKVSAANGFGTQASAGSGAGGTCAEASKVIYLVTSNNELVAFDPTIPGTAAYHLVGYMQCMPLNYLDLSIAVLADGTAIVVAGNGVTYRVDLATAACEPTGWDTAYLAPEEGQFNPIGLAATAASDGSEDEVVYLSAFKQGFGTFSTVDGSFTALTPPYDDGSWIDLAGGPDGRLFALDFSDWQIAEVARGNGAMTPLHQHQLERPAGSGAVGRFAGKLYLFGNDALDQWTVEYDPTTDTETLRDHANGYFVVGAGQSRCVPPPVPS